MPPDTIHVVGAGVAGLACAVACARAGRRVALYEASSRAGGRARSIHHPALGPHDNGTHMLLGANRQALDFVRAIGGAGALSPAPACFSFADLEDRRSWTIRPGRLGTGWRETLTALGLPWTPPGQTLGDRLGRAPSFAAVWQPLAEAMLNTPAEQASARGFARLLRHLLQGGRQAMTPYLFTGGLSAALADPALAVLAACGVRPRFHHRLTGISGTELEFGGRRVRLANGDQVVLAVPSWHAAALLPGIPPLPWHAIINVHYRIEPAPGLPGGAPFLGLTGGTAQWLFARPGGLSLTISAADRLLAMDGDHLAASLWQEIRPLLPDSAPPSGWLVVKERRATIAHTPATETLRPGPTTDSPSLHLAGDWLTSPWPCTIESAVTSGLAAARRATGIRCLKFT